MILAGGFWYARNLIAVGNPLPWSSFGGVLPTPAAPLQQHTGYSVAHYLTGARPGLAHFWSAFAQPALAAGLGRWWYLILAAALVGPLLCLLPERLGRNYVHAELSSQAPVRMLGAVALFSLAAYLVTPETAAGPNGNPVGFAFNLRYLAPALALSLAVAPLARALATTPAARTATLIALASLLAATVAQPRLWPASHTAGAILIATAALVLLALARRRLALLAAAGVALVIAGYALQGHYLRGR